MIYRAALLLSLFFLVGCGTTTSWKNPFSRFFAKKTSIDPDSPPRKDTFVDASDTDLDKDDTGRVRFNDDQVLDSTSDIAQIDFVPGAEIREYSGAAVVARVNGKPIFAEDVLQPRAGEFAKAAQQLSAAELNQLRATFIKNNLTPHIEQAVLVTALKNDIPREQWDDLSSKVRELFDAQEIQRLKAAYKVTTRIELEQQLVKQGTNINKLREAFSDQQLAVYYIKDNNKPKKVQFGRKELLDWYEQNIEKFKVDARVRWRQVRVNYKKGSSTSENKAKARMQAIIAEFSQGAEFETIARKYSDGPKKENGGVWDWTDKGSLAEGALDRALFQIGQGPSEVIDTGNAFVILEVLERTEAGYQPFEKVQDVISKKLQQSIRSNDTGEFIDGLVKSATVWTAFDGPNAPQPRLQ
jgi:peptidyl-prolyl cis-trans isomerase SurA